MDFHSPELLPLIPEKLRRERHVFERYDTRFRAAARMLQALWRERQGLPIGQHLDAEGGRRRLGSRLSTEVARAGGNFLTPDIFGQARCDMAYREPGALVDLERLWGNLLSSMPLAFNLFASLKADKKLATKVFGRLTPALVKEVIHLQFEHSPGRGDLTFTGDGTAFDSFVTTRTRSGGRGFIAVEVKYSESMTEPEARLRPRYDELARSSGLYSEPEDETLRSNPLQSLWRSHMLAQSMCDAGLYDEGAFVLIAPRQNRDVERAARLYADRLEANPAKVQFIHIALEDVIGAIGAGGARDLAAALHARYTDFAPVHALVRQACFAPSRRARPVCPVARPRPAPTPRQKSSSAVASAAR